MRFILSRIFKNNSTINIWWLSYLEKHDFKYYDNHCLNYKIIPFGNYCLPRVITTINRLKPTKKYGEKSFPFDLCFSKFSTNVDLLSKNFRGFFDNITFDKDKNYWISKETNMQFNHDGLLSYNVFKQCYQNRINNLYEVLDDTSVHIYFVVASFENISDIQIKNFIKVLNKFRKNNTYDLIIINQTNNIQKSDFKNIHYINLNNDKSFKSINAANDWVSELKKMKSINARIFNNKVISKLSKIIIHHKHI